MPQTCLALIACSLFALSVHAEDYSALGINRQYAQAGWWTIGFHAGNDGCLLAGSYGPYSRFARISAWVGFYVDSNADLKTFFAITSPAWTINQDQEYTFGVQLDRRGFVAHGYGVKWKDEQGFLVENVSETFLEAFRESDTYLTPVLSLTGTRDAVGKTIECQSRSGTVFADLRNNRSPSQRQHDDRSGTNQAESETQKQGTGFFISEGFLLTANHVAEGCGNIEIRTTNGRQKLATVVKSHKQNDLASAEFEPEVQLVHGRPGLDGGVSSTQNWETVGRTLLVFVVVQQLESNVIMPLRYFPGIEGARRSETFETASAVLKPIQRNRPELDLSLDLPTVERIDLTRREQRAIPTIRSAPEDWQFL